MIASGYTYVNNSPMLLSVRGAKEACLARLIQGIEV